MSKTRELTNRISCLDLSPKYRKRPEKLVDVGVQVAFWSLFWTFSVDVWWKLTITITSGGILVPFLRIFGANFNPNCLFCGNTTAGGDRLNHSSESCSHGTRTWFTFAAGEHPKYEKTKNTIPITKNRRNTQEWEDDRCRFRILPRQETVITLQGVGLQNRCYLCHMC